MASSSNNPKGDNVSTYMVQDSKKKEELLRLILQSRMITTAMGGVFAEQPDPGAFRHVLDIACGTGEWVLEAARTYPEKNFIGIDINTMMIDYARTQAQAQNFTDRVEFHVMDALKKLDFSENSFDLVNLRYPMSFVRTWDWPSLLLEMQRVARPGGIIRVTEAEITAPSTSQALTDLYGLATRAMYRAGHLFTPEAAGLTNHLAELLTKSWCEDVHTKVHPLLFRAGTPEGEMFIEDLRYLHITTTPFVQKWVGLPENYDAMYRQSRKDMKQPEFSATWPLVTVWGSKPLAIGK